MTTKSVLLRPQGLRPRARALTFPLATPLIRLVVTGGSLTRIPKRSLGCLLVEIYTLTINEYLNLGSDRVEYTIPSYRSTVKNSSMSTGVARNFEWEDPKLGKKL